MKFLKRLGSGITDLLAFYFALPIALTILLCGCSISPKEESRVVDFYRYAKRRMHNPIANSPPPIRDLTVTLSGIPGCGRGPLINEDSIVVSDPDPSEKYIVQVIVSPRVSGSFLDPAHPTAEFLAQMHRETVQALELHRYMNVSLCRKQEPHPYAEQSSARNREHTRVR